MSADLTTLAVAIIGVADTLSPPLLGQRIAARAKQQEFDLQSQRQEEREEAQQQSALELHRFNLCRTQHRRASVPARTRSLSTHDRRRRPYG